MKDQKKRHFFLENEERTTEEVVDSRWKEGIRMLIEIGENKRKREERLNDCVHKHRWFKGN